MTDVLGDTIPGMQVVKAFSQEEREKKRFDVRNRDVTNEFNRIHEMWTLFWPILMLAIHGMTIAVWAFALPRLLGTVEPELSAGMFVSFLLYTTMFVSPIEIIGQVARILNRATTSAHRVFEVLDTEPEVVDSGGAAAPRAGAGEARVRQRDVWLRRSPAGAARHQLRRRARRGDRTGRAVGRREVDDRESDRALL